MKKSEIFFFFIIGVSEDIYRESRVLEREGEVREVLVGKV